MLPIQFNSITPHTCDMTLHTHKIVCVDTGKTYLVLHFNGYHGANSMVKLDEWVSSGDSLVVERGIDGRENLD
jgi:hypothetical protein